MWEFDFSGAFKGKDKVQELTKENQQLLYIATHSLTTH